MNSKFESRVPHFQSLEQRREKQSSKTRVATGKPKPAKKSPNRTYHSDERESIYPAVPKNAGQKKSDSPFRAKNSEKINEKKTGALSPRAPEKIRKNRAEEMKVYGENSCFALFQQRPDAIVRLWITVEVAKKSGELLSYLAKNQKAYHVVDSAELEKVAGTEHHGGICLLVKKATSFTLEGYLALPRQYDCLVLLDGVNNALNIGGVVRTCAYYGVKSIIVENADLFNSSSAARVAEGGLEFVRALETKHKKVALEQLRNAGYQIVHLTRQKQIMPLAKVTLAAKTVFVLSEIVPNEVVYPQDISVRLSLDNPLNSDLNVAVSAGVLLAQWYQTHIM